MSTPFRPLEIPPGVVATATKKMRSSNWSEVNFMRWREGQLTPMGGQSQFTNVVGGVDQYVFASRCKAIHGWYDLEGIYHIAYLCESNLYVDTGGALSDITPPDGIAPPSGLIGGYGDDTYNLDEYGTPRPIPGSVAITKVPDAYSLDNFGSILYAMTSTDGRLLMWDPANGSGVISGVTAAGAFTTTSPIIYTTSIPASVMPGETVTDTTLGQVLGSVQSVATTVATTSALAQFFPPQSSVLAGPPPVGAGPGLTVVNTTTGQPVGMILTYAQLVQVTDAQGSFTSNYRAVFALPNPGWGIAGLTVRDLTLGVTLGTLDVWGPFNFNATSTTVIPAGTTTVIMDEANSGVVIPGMAITSGDIPGWTATVVTWLNRALQLSAAIPINVNSVIFHFSSGAQSVLIWDFSGGGGPVNSAGANDVLQLTSGTNAVITFTAPVASSSSGATDVLSITGGSTLTLMANSAYASAGPTDALSFGANRALVQEPDSGRGPVPHGRCFVVTQERFIMICGSTDDGTTGGGSARRFAWCDQENPGAWDYSNVTSQAGFLDIEPASPIICAIETRVGILMWTGKKAYVSQFLGVPYVYNYVELADNCTPWSPQSMATTSSLTLWFSEQGVFSFDGTSIMPVACRVRPWIDDAIDPIQVRELSFAAHLGEFSEWWWFWPSMNSPFNTCAAVYNYKEGWWTQCRLSRSAGITSSYTSHPIFADDFVAFQHEVGASYQNAVGNLPVVQPFAESFDLNINSGSRLTTVKQLIPDVEAVGATDPTAIANAIANLRYSIFYRNSRSLGAPELQTPLITPRSDGFVDLRATGRDIRLRIDVATPIIQPFTLGQHQIDAVPRGDR